MALVHAGLDPTIIALDGTRLAAQHTHEHPRRQEAGATSRRPAHATGNDTWPIPGTRRTPRLPRQPVAYDAMPRPRPHCPHPLAPAVRTRHSCGAGIVA